MFCNIWFNSRIADTLQEIKVYVGIVLKAVLGANYYFYWYSKSIR